MKLTRRRLLRHIGCAAAALSPVARAQPAAAAARPALDAPNPVWLGPRLLTAGQPTAQALAGLGQQGFQAVVYLAPSTVPDAVPDEAAILARQGITFVHIPVPFEHPTEAHFLAFTQALQRLQQQQVLVHCQVNMRASTLSFLHRAITLRHDPALAYQAVTQVWTPQGRWRALMLQLLQRHGIDFQPL